LELKLAPRDQIILAVMIAVLIMLGFGIFGLRPQLSSIAELRSQQQEELKKKQNSEATLQRLKQAKKEAAETETKLIESKQRVPDDPQLASLLVEIQDTANQAGVDFVSIKPDVMVAQANMTNIPLLIHIEGSFYDLVDFLYRLKDLKREIRIDKVTIVGTEWPNLSVDLEGSTFTLAKPPVSKSAPSTSGQGK
jgi:type IV pilus assembly protein PilO